MKAEYVTLLTIFISLLSGWGAAFITGYLSRKASTDRIFKEYEIEKTKKEDRDKKQLLNMYIDLIKLDLETNPVIYGYNGEAKFDFHFYSEEISPVIYSKYELIHPEVIKCFNRIEELNSSIEKASLFNFDGINMTEIVMDISSYYEDMIKEVKLIVDKNRFKE